MLRMTAHPHRIVLVADPRTRPAAPSVRRYQLARLRLAERRGTPPRQAPHLHRAYD
jgi:hypothetical protein